MLLLSFSARNRRRLTALSMGPALVVVSVACTWRPHRPPYRTTTTYEMTTTTTASTTSTEPSTTTTTAGTTTTTTAPSGNTVTYELANFTITKTAGMILPGANTITVTNVGTAPHEITFVRADTAASLPTLPNGAVDMSQIALADNLGTVRATAGTSASGTVTFTPGSYVALCNVGAAGTNPHFARGMFLEFSVI